MKKSLSLLVAIAMVFSMFATVASAATASEAGAYLKGLGIIQGAAGTGDLMEESTWKRQDLAVLIARLMGEEAEAQQTAKGHTYADVRGTYYDGFLTWAKEEGLMQGHSETRFGFDEELTYQQFATVVLRALGIDTSDYAAVPELAVEAGIVAEGTNFTAPAQRGATYVVIVQALDTEVAGTGKKLGEILGFADFIPDLPAVSAAASGAKKATVTFNQAIDTEKAEFEVKRGSVVLKVAGKTFSEDKKVATLEMDAKFTTGEYVVTVKEVTEDALTATFTAENEKISGIEFDGDKLASNDDRSNAFVSFKVTNQYGENITATSGGSIYWTSSKGTPQATSSGKLTLAGGAPNYFTVTEKVLVTGVHSSGSASVTATLEVGFPSRVETVTVKELYHPEGKTIASGVTFSEFVLLVDVKDQYGNILDATKFEDEVVKTVSRIDIFNLGEAKDGQGKDKNSVGIPLSGPTGGMVSTGVNTITFISKYSTTRTTFDVEVGKGKVVETITLEQPDKQVAAGDGTVKIPFVALDGQGNRLTKIDDLGDAKVSLTGGIVWKYDFVTKEAYIELAVPAVGPTRLSLMATVVGTTNFNQLFVDVLAKATPTEVRNLKDVSANRLFTGSVGTPQTVTIEPKHILLQDNYGRELNGKDLDFANYELVVKKVNGATGITLTTATLDSATDTAVISATEAGDIRINVELVKATSPEAGAKSDKNFDLTFISPSVINGYTVEDVAKFNTVHAPEVKLVGKTNTISNISIPADKYTVITQSGSGVTASVVGGKWLLDASGAFAPESTATEKTFTFTVQPLDNAAAITKTTTVVKESVQIKKHEFRNASSDGLTYKDGVVKVTEAAIVNPGNLLKAIKFTDQFDKEYTPAAANVYATITNSNTGDNQNGLLSTIDFVDDLEDGDSFEISLIVNGSYSVAKFKVEVIPNP